MDKVVLFSLMLAIAIAVPILIWENGKRTRGTKFSKRVRGTAPGRKT